MGDRVSGWYWVRIKSNSLKWEILQYYAKRWWRSGVETEVDRDDILTIGERVVEPC